MSKNKIELSIGMIFKNEIRCIERCLKSLKPLREAISCELILGDTGAGDGSRAIAEQYADRVIDVPWTDDFAAARNQVLELCTGRIFMFIDCDEWLEADVSPLLRAIRSFPNQYQIGLLTSRNYMSRDFSVFQDDHVGRLAYNVPGKLRFKGKIHENLFYWKADGSKESVSARAFYEVILHHDGYVDVDGSVKRKYEERNLPMLQAELEERPDDAFLLIQCMQSSIEKEDIVRYVKEAAEKTKTPKWDKSPALSYIYQNVMQAASRYNDIPFAEEIIALWEQRRPNSSILKLDGYGYLINTYHKRLEYDKILQYAEVWMKTLQDADKLSSSADMEFAFTSLRMAIPGSAVINLQDILGAACQRKSWEIAQQAVDLLADYPLNRDLLEVILLLLIANAEELRMDEWFGKRWRLLHEAKESEKKQEREEAEASLAMIKETLQRFETNPAVLKQLAGLDCAPGISAAILLSEKREEAPALLQQVDDWNEMMIAALVRVVSLGIDFPTSFYQQTSAELRELAVSMAQNESETMEQLSAWLELPFESLRQLQFRFELCASVLRNIETGKTEEAEALYRRFLTLAEALLTRMYSPEMHGFSLHPELLGQNIDTEGKTPGSGILAAYEENIMALPGLHSFAWYVLRCEMALQKPDFLSAVRLLKRALHAAPGMKDFLKWKISSIQLQQRKENEKRRSSITPEMQQLADQIQAILAQYPADVPEVQAILASPAYQQVAWIFEATEDDLYSLN